MLRCRAAGDDEQFFTIALQVAAAEARQGHRTLAEGIRDAVEKARAHSGFGQTVTVPFAALRGDLADLIELPEGAFLEVELKRGTRIETVERKRDGITPGAARREETDIRIVGLYVPDDAREVFLDILHEYQVGERIPKGKPRRKGFVEAIESIRQAHLETFWTDDVSRLPPPGREMWWEIWCLRRFEDDLEDLIERLGARAAERERRLYFPEHVVLPVLADRATSELMLFARRVAP